MGNVKNVRLTLVKLIPAGKLLKRGQFAGILIAGNVKFMQVLRNTLILNLSLKQLYLKLTSFYLSIAHEINSGFKWRRRT